MYYSTSGLATTKANPTSFIPNLFGTSGKSEGMQLGTIKVSASTSHFVAGWAREAAAEAEANQGSNPCGNDDLMDVNADQDDWSTFSSACTDV